MKKKIVLFLILFLLTGCDGTYELEIYNNQVTEKATAWYNQEEVTKDIYDYTVELSAKYDDNGDFLRYDRKKTLQKKNQKGLQLINKYSSIEDYKENSNILGYCYIAQSITNYEKDYITVKTANEFTCMKEIEEVDNVTIAIKSNHKLKETNADKVKGHTYYWYINKDNYENKPISLVLYSDRYVLNYDNIIFKRLGLIILVISGTVLITFVIYQLYQRKNEQN